VPIDTHSHANLHGKITHSINTTEDSVDAKALFIAVVSPRKERSHGMVAMDLYEGIGVRRLVILAQEWKNLKCFLLLIGDGQLPAVLLIALQVE
jgi:hypothetical protein